MASIMTLLYRQVLTSYSNPSSKRGLQVLQVLVKCQGSTSILNTDTLNHIRMGSRPCFKYKSLDAPPRSGVVVGPGYLAISSLGARRRLKLGVHLDLELLQHAPTVHGNHLPLRPHAIALSGTSQYSPRNHSSSDPWGQAVVGDCGAFSP